ncbi:hypothetical protein DIPPA_08694 [Diplonema papillatum]|nr:hypothetical protein DIPPA_08694 [Diplonema papillatum]
MAASYGTMHDVDLGDGSHHSASPSEQFSTLWKGSRLHNLVLLSPLCWFVPPTETVGLVLNAFVMIGVFSLMASSAREIEAAVSRPLGNLIGAVSSVLGGFLVGVSSGSAQVQQWLVVGSVLAQGGFFGLHAVAWSRDRGVKCEPRPTNALLASLFLFASLVAAFPSYIPDDQNAVFASRISGLLLLLMFAASLTNVPSVQVPECLDAMESQHFPCFPSLLVPISTWIISAVILCSVVQFFAQSVAATALPDSLLYVVLLPLFLLSPQLCSARASFDEVVSGLLRVSTSTVTLLFPLFSFLHSQKRPFLPPASLITLLPVFSGILKLLVSCNYISSFEGWMIVAFYAASACYATLV